MKTDNKYYRKKICLIGAGKVGSALYHALTNNGFNIIYVIEKNTIRTRKATKKNKNVIIKKSISEKIINESDVIIFAVQENNLKKVINSLLKFKKLLYDKILFHLSGVETSDLFNDKGISKKITGSFHPLQTFNAISYNNNKLLSNIYYGIEGGEEAVKYFKFLCGKLKSNYILIPKNKKVLYHSACVIASNFLVTHFNILSKITKELTGNKRDIKIFQPIVKTTLDNILISGTEKALTGPFARGDINTIDLHLKYFKEKIPEHLLYYILLGLETLNLSIDGKKLPVRTAEKIEKLLLNNI